MDLVVRCYRLDTSVLSPAPQSRVVLQPLAGSALLPQAVRGPVRVAAFASVTAGMLGAARLHQSVVADARRQAGFARYQHGWYRALLDLFGVRVALAGDPAATARAGGRLVVANHRSTLDVAVLGWLFGGRLLSRADVARWPLLGAAARAAGTIFVDRQKRSSGANALRVIRSALRDGATIVLFPEGTTHVDDHVRAFRRGAFAAAAELDVTVVPVGLAYDSSRRAIFGAESFAAHAARIAAGPGVSVAVRVGDPIAGDRSSAVLAAAAHAAVQDLVDAARRDCALLEERRR